MPATDTITQPAAARPAAARESAPRYAYVDSLRFIAAAMVLFQHVLESSTGLVSSFIVSLGPGVAGVALFFLVSGYVIPLAVGRRKFVLSSFATRRIFRIYPLYITTLAVIAIGWSAGLWPTWPNYTAVTAPAWIANIFLVQDFVRAPTVLAVSWTLAIEFIWYGMFALAYLVFGPRTADRLEAFVVVSLVGLTLASLVLGQRIPLGRPTMIYAAVLGYQTFRYQAGEMSRPRFQLSVAMFALVALSASYVAFGYFRHPQITLAQSMGPWTMSSIVFLSVMLVRPIRSARILNHGVMPLLGAMSYSIYLLHPLAMFALVNRVDPAFEPIAVVALTMVLAAIGYYAIERRGIRAGRVVETWLAGPAKA